MHSRWREQRPESRKPDWQAAQGSLGPAASELSQHSLLAPGWGRGEGGLKPSQPGVVHLSGVELDMPRVGLQRALTLVHLEQTLLNARVNAGGDEALNLHALARKGVLVVTVTVIRGDTPGVSQGTGGQVARAVFGSREHVAPQEFSFGHGLVRVETTRERASSVRVSHSARIGRL